MSKMCKIFYELSEKGRKESLLSNGDGKKIQCIETPITKELLNIETVSVDENGEAKLHVGRFSPKSEAVLTNSSTRIIQNGINYYKPYIEYKKENINFDYIPTVDELINWEKNRLEKLKKSEEDIQEEYEKRLNIYNEKDNEYKKEKELEEIERNKEKEAVRLKKEQEKEDDASWIKENGSERLKLCLELGYECKRLYINERVESEFPDYELDFDDNASWKERVSPSMEALKEVKKLIDLGYDAEIVWLTESVHGSDYDYENDFEECEAIAFQFKGYWLVKQI